jgi:hypothetical protein
MRPMGRRVADTGPCSRDSVASPGREGGDPTQHSDRSLEIIRDEAEGRDRAGERLHRRSNGTHQNRGAPDDAVGASVAAPQMLDAEARKHTRVSPPHRGRGQGCAGSGRPGQVDGFRRSVMRRLPEWATHDQRGCGPAPRYSPSARPRLPRRLAAGPTPGWPCARSRRFMAGLSCRAPPSAVPAADGAEVPAHAALLHRRTACQRPRLWMSLWITSESRTIQPLSCRVMRMPIRSLVLMDTVFVGRVSSSARP